MHYDLFHRASCRLNGTAPVRFLVKFQFLRTTEPTAPAVRVVNVPRFLVQSVPNAHVDPIVEEPGRALEATKAALKATKEIWKSARNRLEIHATRSFNRLQDICAWLRGGSSRISLGLSERARQAELLRGSSEVERLAAAYRLGQVGARQVLLQGLLDASESVARCCAYGLAASGPEGASCVQRLLKHRQAERSYLPAVCRVRRLAAFVVGESGRPELGLVQALGEAMQEEFCVAPRRFRRVQRAARLENVKETQQQGWRRPNFESQNRV